MSPGAAPTALPRPVGRTRHRKGPAEPAGTSTSGARKELLPEAAARALPPPAVGPFSKLTASTWCAGAGGRGRKRGARVLLLGSHALLSLLPRFLPPGLALLVIGVALTDAVTAFLAGGGLVFLLR